MGWRLAADAVVAVHVAFVTFVVLGGLLVLRWRWVALVHVPVILYGVMIELVGFTCPLTPLEKSLRHHAGSAGYDGGFVEHYVVPVLYPGEFTPRVKVAMAIVIVTVNALVYALVWRRYVRTNRTVGQRTARAPGSAPLPKDRTSRPPA